MSPPLQLTLLLVLLNIHSSLGQVFFKGECPDPPTVVDFKLWLFEGTWYETQRWYSIKDKGHCMRHTFTDLGYGTLDVLTEMNRGKSYEYRRGLARLSVSKSSKGYGYEKHSYGQTKYTLRYDDKQGEKGDAETFFVLDTDYWTYAIIWSCSSKKFFNMQYLRILTRSPYPHSHTLLKVYRELEYLGLDQQHLTLVDDKQKCHYQVAQTHYKKGYGHGHGKGKGGGGGGHSLPRPAYPVSYTSLLSEVKPGGSHGGGLEHGYSYEPVATYEPTGYSGGGGGTYDVGGGGGGGYDVGGGGHAGGGGYSGGGADVIGPGISQESYSGGGGGYSGGGGGGYSGGGGGYGGDAGGYGGGAGGEYGGGYGGGEVGYGGGEVSYGGEGRYSGGGGGGGGGYSGGGGDGYSGGGGTGYSGGGGTDYAGSYGGGGEGYSEDVSLGYGGGGGGGGEGYSEGGYTAPSSGYGAPSAAESYSGGGGGSSYTSYSQSSDGKY